MSITILNPYLANGFTWLRGNLHTHTTVSDGDFEPAAIIAEYERRGYDFLALSDHDALVNHFDFQGATGMTLIPADEITRNGPHVLAVQIREVVPPEADRQLAIDHANAQGGFAVLNHPNWQRHFNHFSQELMEALTGYLGIEIYNGVIERLEGSSLALDRWDKLLAGGRRVWGFAHDDAHKPIDIARGWNVAQARDRTGAAIVEALRAGRFYASTGVAIERIGVHENTIRVDAPNAQRIRFLGAYGKEFRYVNAAEASYDVTGDEGNYVRVECFGPGVAMAWTQPLFVTSAG